VRFRLPVALGFGLFLATLAPAAHAQEPVASKEAAPPPGADRPPAGARVTHVVAGAATTALFYGAVVGFSYLAPDEPGSPDLRIPIAGPWIALSKAGCAEDEPDCSLVLVVIRAALTLMDGVGQAGGLGIIGEGLFLNTSSPRPTALGAPRTDLPQVKVRAVPLDLGRSGVGLGLVGTF